MFHLINRRSNLFLIFLVPVTVFSQSYEPSILVLQPSNVQIEKGLLKEVDKFNKHIEENRAEKIKQLEEALEMAGNRTKNIRIMLSKQTEFYQSADFNSMMSFGAAEYLTYKIYQRFKNTLIYPVNEYADSTIQQLSKLAEKYDMQYVVNFPSAKFEIKNGKRTLKLTVQLYDHTQKKILIDNVFNGNDENPGFEFTCEEGTISCTINNAMSDAVYSVLKIIGTQSSAIIHEEDLRSNRNRLLSSQLGNAPNPQIAKTIETYSPDLFNEGYYYGITDSSETKLIGFFALDNESETYKQMNRDEEAGYVDYFNLDYSNDYSNGIYTYAVVGILYDSTWYFKKEKISWYNKSALDSSKVAYFNRLQEWEFFVDYDTLFNPQFWETKFFKKVPDLTKDPMWKKYGTSIWKPDEMENRPYVGIYEMVVKQLQLEIEQKKVQITYEITKNVIQPFLENLKSEQPEECKSYTTILDKEFILIFPYDLSAVLNPVLITNAQGMKQIRYFIAFPGSNDIYEWIYLKPRIHQETDRIYSMEVVEELEIATTWNYGTLTLNDSNFWNNLVFKKENGEYVYLKKL